MKIIHVAGLSGSGKTTFIMDLLRELNCKGPTAVVKHLGHHQWQLEERKDTTIFYKNGACITAGIDGEKSIYIVPDSTLDMALSLISGSGMEYVIVEGFKNRAYPKIVIGDPGEMENIILKDPCVEDVLMSLSLFEDFFTIEELIKDLRRECDMTRAGAILTFNGIVREWTDSERTEYMEFYENFDRLIIEIREEMESADGILGVRIHHRKGRLYAGEDITYIAVCARGRHEAFLVLSRAIDRLKLELHEKDKDHSGA
ncbi:MAG TPA: molybdopterin-guanine dinucleotide biosynthesis protein B [Methanoregulaceae archaeon]|nr:molybdopterin-guanine dinucleotide biosynthesis protein B [Methanoregulaceae archaeon]